MTDVIGRPLDARLIMIHQLCWHFKRAYLIILIILRSSLSTVNWCAVVIWLQRLRFKRLKLVDSLFVQSKLFIIENIWIEKFFELSDCSPVVLILLYLVKAGLICLVVSFLIALSLLGHYFFLTDWSRLVFLFHVRHWWLLLFHGRANRVLRIDFLRWFNILFW